MEESCLFKIRIITFYKLNFVHFKLQNYNELKIFYFLYLMINLYILIKVSIAYSDSYVFKKFNYMKTHY